MTGGKRPSDISTQRGGVARRSMKAWFGWRYQQWTGRLKRREAGEGVAAAKRWQAKAIVVGNLVIDKRHRLSASRVSRRVFARVAPSGVDRQHS